jgi:hypothetical protein
MAERASVQAAEPRDRQAGGEGYVGPAQQQQLALGEGGQQKSHKLWKSHLCTEKSNAAFQRRLESRVQNKLKEKVQLEAKAQDTEAILRRNWPLKKDFFLFEVDSGLSKVKGSSHRN